MIHHCSARCLFFAPNVRKMCHSAQHIVCLLLVLASAASTRMIPSTIELHVEPHNLEQPEQVSTSRILRNADNTVNEERSIVDSHRHNIRNRTRAVPANNKPTSSVTISSVSSVPMSVSASASNDIIPSTKLESSTSTVSISASASVSTSTVTTLLYSNASTTSSISTSGVMNTTQATTTTTLIVPEITTTTPPNNNNSDGKLAHKTHIETLIVSVSVGGGMCILILAFVIGYRQTRR